MYARACCNSGNLGLAEARWDGKVPTRTPGYNTGAMAEDPIVLANRSFSPAEWEGICRRCGGCCHEKEVEADGRVRYLDLPCPQLTAGDLCHVYERRFEVESACNLVTPALIREGIVLPPGCAYLDLYEDLLEEMEREIRLRGSRRRP